MRKRRVCAGAVLALVVAVLAVACSAAGESGGSADLLVTADFGSEVLAEESIPAGPSVLAALQGITDVDTAFGGGFVRGMYGRASSADPPADWFYFVDGRLAETGARGRAVPAAGHIWWDHRPWGGPNEVRAVIGSWPAPFAGPDRQVRADPPLAPVAEAAGAVLTTGETPWRILVGSDAELRARSDRWRRAGDDPAAAGVAATIRDARVQILDPRGELAPVPDGSAVAVAVAGGLREEDGLSLIIAGVDAGAADAAARSIAADPELLVGQFALAFDRDGEVVAEAGRP